MPIVRLLSLAGRFLGTPGEHPWRVFFLVFGFLSTTIAVIDHYAGSGFHAPVGWERAVREGFISGVVCACLATLITFRRGTG